MQSRLRGVFGFASRKPCIPAEKMGMLHDRGDRMEHPLRNGLLLALALTMAMVAAGHTQMTAAFPDGDGEAASFLWGMSFAVLPGAFLAALPRRIRAWKSKTRPEKPSLRRCILCFLGGLLLTVGLRLTGDITAGALQGSISGCSALLAAWGTGFVLLRLGRRRA